jgi:hypothetical protein
MRTDRLSYLLSLATMGPQLLSEGGDDDPSGGGGGGDPAPVPYSRFKAVNAKYSEARTRIAELEAEVQTLTEKSATLDTVSSTFQREKTSWAQERAGLQERLGLSELGLTSQEGQTVAKSLFGALGEDARKDPTLIDQVKAWPEQPDEAPAGLRPYLGSGGEQGGGGSGGRRDPNKGTKVGGGEDAGGEVTADAIRAAREKAMKTGSWDEFDELVKRHGR